ncbi:hypothetical protein C8J56DRAFT_1060254 [Mycena floridula]|nr:hypothetical protein C8J56DRAFT_1060254 [Mycena floridula]
MNQLYSTPQVYRGAPVAAPMAHATPRQAEQVPKAYDRSAPARAPVRDEPLHPPGLLPLPKDIIKPNSGRKPHFPSTLNVEPRRQRDWEHSKLPHLSADTNGHRVENPNRFPQSNAIYPPQASPHNQTLTSYDQGALGRPPVQGVEYWANKTQIWPCVPAPKYTRGSKRMEEPQRRV